MLQTYNCNHVRYWIIFIIQSDTTLQTCTQAVQMTLAGSLFTTTGLNIQGSHYGWTGNLLTWTWFHQKTIHYAARGWRLIRVLHNGGSPLFPTFVNFETFRGDSRRCQAKTRILFLEYQGQTIDVNSNSHVSLDSTDWNTAEHSQQVLASTTWLTIPGWLKLTNDAFYLTITAVFQHMEYH